MSNPPTTKKSTARPPTIKLLFELIPDTYLTNPKFILHLMRQFDAVSCHPSSSFGYYCSYPVHTTSLITFLADPMECPTKSWKHYRAQLSTQLSHCTQCLIQHHHQVIDWESHPTNQSYDFSRMHKMQQSLSDFDVERVYQALRDGFSHLQGSPRSNSVTSSRYKHALFEILISIRLCMQMKVTNLLPVVFLRRCPINDDDLKLFFTELGYLPPGLISLCFHPKQAVRDWAVQTFNRFSSQFPLQDEPTTYILGRVLSSLRRSLHLENTPNESWDPTPFDVLKLHEFVLSFATIVPLLSDDALLDIFTLSKGSTAKILSIGLALKNDEDIIRHSAETLALLMHRISFDTIFHVKYMSVDAFINDLFILLRDAERTTAERTHFLNLLKHVLLQGRKRLGKAAVLRLHDKIFSVLEFECQQSDISFGNLRHIGNTSKFECRRREMLDVGSSVLNWMFELSSPKPPLCKLERIVDFIIAVLHDDSENVAGWNLLRTALALDIFNVIQCVRDPDSSSLIIESFNTRPALIVLSADEKDVLKNIFEKSKNEPKRITFNSVLWNEIRNGTHLLPDVSAGGRANEIKVFLDLNRLFGCVKPGRLAETLTKEELSSVFVEAAGSGSEKANYASDCVEVMQKGIIHRLKTAMNKGGEEGWIDELPFHVSQMMCCVDNDVSNGCLRGLLRMYNVNSATVSGMKSKTALISLRKDCLHSSSFAMGFASISRIIYAWGNVVPLLTYTQYFKWYRGLIDTKFQELLVGVHSSEWVLGIICNFLLNWKRMESEGRTEQFKELCCGFFGILWDVWDELYGLSGLVFKISKLERRKIQKWITTIHSCLLDMHELKDPIVKTAWVSTVSKLSPNWKHVEGYRQKLLMILEEHAKIRDRLSLQDCEKLAASVDLDAKSVLRSWYDDEEVMMEAFASLSAKKSLPPTKKKKLTMTRIDDHFTSKNTAGSSSITASTSRTVTNTKNPKASVFIKKPIRTGRRSPPLPVEKSGGLPSTGGRFGVSGERAMTKIEELKLERRQNSRSYAAGGRRTVGQSSINSSIPDIVMLDSPAGPPPPTKFDLHRERFKRDKREREQNGASCEKKIEKERKLPIFRQKGIDVSHTATLSYKPPPRTCVSPRRSVSPIPIPLPENYSVPPARRYANCGTAESVYSSFINGRGSFEGADRQHNYEYSRGESFRNVAEYVFFWEPLLREEFRASVETAKKDEEDYFSKHGEPCRLHFQVAMGGTIGNDHVIEVSYDVWKLRKLRKDDAGDQFHPIKARPNDIMLVTSLMPSELPNGQPTPIKSALALVVNMTQERGQFLLKLKIGFRNRADIPPVGHLVSVSRLTSLVTFQRQIEALYDLDKLPDGLLWPILEPKIGWAKNDGAMKRVDESCGAKLKAPRQFIDHMLRKKELNESQAKAIRAVVIACGPIFTPRGVSKGPYFDHGGITLIQGPPGTGKTSTVVTMLSTLLFANGSNYPERKLAFDLEGGERHVMTTPPVRVLVCAPSNAAVDEIMSRVVERGLTTPSGSKACPRIARVGAGSTIEKLKLLELRRLAGIDEQVSPFDAALAESEKKKKEHLDKSRVFNEEIRVVDRTQKALRAQLDEIVKSRGKVEDEKKRREKEDKTYGELKIVSANLTKLHSRKNAVNDCISDDRNLKKGLQEKKKREQDLRMASVLNNAVIVFATLNSSGHELVHRLGAPFDLTIVDEAAQCVEPDVVIAATVGRRRAGCIGHSHLVMVGDPKQLPATVLSRNGAVSARLGCSMFERFSDSSPETVHMLDTQYRMHPKISLFPSRQFYGGLLKNGVSVLSEEAMKQPFHEDSRGRFGPLTFIDTKVAAFREQHSARGSTSNADEARMIVSAIVAMVRRYPSFHFKDKIAVLTPYREQVMMFRRILNRTKALDDVAVEVSTVDGIQGREKSVVFLSTVRGFNTKSIGFLRDLRRMNVAITRAKHSVIITGNSEVLSENDKTWKSLVEQCKEEGVMLEAARQDTELFPESSWNWKYTPPAYGPNQRNRRTKPANSNGDNQKKIVKGAEALKKDSGAGSVVENQVSASTAAAGKRLRSALPADDVVPCAKRRRGKNETRGIESENVSNGKENNTDVQRTILKEPPASVPVRPLLRSIPLSAVPVLGGGDGGKAQVNKNALPSTGNQIPCGILSVLRSVPVANVLGSEKAKALEAGNGKRFNDAVTHGSKILSPKIGRGGSSGDTSSDANVNVTVGKRETDESQEIPGSRSVAGNTTKDKSGGSMGGVETSGTAAKSSYSTLNVKKRSSAELAGEVVVCKPNVKQKTERKIVVTKSGEVRGQPPASRNERRIEEVECHHCAKSVASQSKSPPPSMPVLKLSPSEAVNGGRRDGNRNNEDGFGKSIGSRKEGILVSDYRSTETLGSPRPWVPSRSQRNEGKIMNETGINMVTDDKSGEVKRRTVAALVKTRTYVVGADSGGVFFPNCRKAEMEKKKKEKLPKTLSQPHPRVHVPKLVSSNPVNDEEIMWHNRGRPEVQNSEKDMDGTGVTKVLRNSERVENLVKDMGRTGGIKVSRNSERVEILEKDIGSRTGGSEVLRNSERGHESNTGVHGAALINSRSSRIRVAAVTGGAGSKDHMNENQWRGSRNEVEYIGSKGPEGDGKKMVGRNYGRERNGGNWNRGEDRRDGNDRRHHRQQYQRAEAGARYDEAYRNHKSSGWVRDERGHQDAGRETRTFNVERGQWERNGAARQGRPNVVHGARGRRQVQGDERGEFGYGEKYRMGGGGGRVGRNGVEDGWRRGAIEGRGGRGRRAEGENVSRGGGRGGFCLLESQNNMQRTQEMARRAREGGGR